MRSPALITLAVLFTLPSLSGAEVFTWKDASGKTVYSDKPPLETKVPTRELKSGRSSGGTPAAAPAQSADGRTAAAGGSDSGTAPAKSAEQIKAETDARSRLCDNARKRFIQLESTEGILTTRNAQGQEVPLVGEARKTELESARKDVDNWCKE